LKEGGEVKGERGGLKHSRSKGISERKGTEGASSPEGEGGAERTFKSRRESFTRNCREKNLLSKEM